MQIIRQLLGNDIIDCRFSFRRSQFALCLAFKLQNRLRDRTGNDRGQAFPDIASFEIPVSFFQKTVLTGKFIDDLRESGLVADLVRTAITRSDQIDIGEGILLLAVRLLKCDIYTDAVLLSGKSDRIMKNVLIFVQIVHKCFEAFLIEKFLLFTGSLIPDRQLDIF